MKALPSGKQVSQILLEPMQLKALAAYLALIDLKRYSPATRRSYGTAFRYFLSGFPGRKPSVISKAEIMDWLLRQQKVHDWSGSYQNLMINAIKFFYEQLLKRPREEYDLPRAKEPHLLPNILSVEEVLRLFECTGNRKHRLLLMLAYSGGLRISEVVNLELLPVPGSPGVFQAAFSPASNGLYSVEALSRKDTRDGKPYFELVLNDGQGKLTLKAWSDAPAFAFCEGSCVGAFVEVQGDFFCRGGKRRWDRFQGPR